MKSFSIIIFYLLINFCHAQNSNKVIIHTDNCDNLIAGIDNYISIISVQDTFLSEEQVSAYLITSYTYIQDKEPIKLKIEKEYGKFKIRPDSIGIVEFRIKLRGNIEIKSKLVEPIKAVCRLSQYKANSEKKIPISIFKNQIGIIATVECCGFDAKCRMLKFEIIRINSANISTRITNIGGKFEEGSLNLIKKAQTGDIYIFRNIYYQCSLSDKQRSEDMIFEIE